MASQVVQRANNASNLYAAIKSRGSNTGPAGCGYIYASEVNQCPCYRHKVKITPQNSPGYDRTVRFELPNYGFLEHVFLESHFAQGNTHHGVIQAGSGAGQATDLVADAKKYDIALCFGAGAFLFNEARLVFRGQEVARISSDYIVMRHMMDLDEERLDNFLSGIGGFPVGTQNTNHTAASSTNRTGRYQLTENAAGQRFYCPLNFWFTETRSRALDLSILHSPITLEIDVRPFSGIKENKLVPGSAAVSDITLNELNLQCFLAELPAPELKMFRDVSYKPGGEPLSQLGYDILTSVHNVNVSSTKTHSIKLNDFSGLVQRLYVFAVDNVERTTHNRYLTLTELIEKITFESVDTEIYEREHMGYIGVNGKHSSEDLTGAAATSVNGVKTKITGEKIMDYYLQPSKELLDPFKMYDYDTNGARIIPGAFQVINFKSDWDQRTSATGSISFGTIHNPTLKITFGSGISTTSLDIIVIAELNNMILYETNGAGATSIRRITE
eukprot:SAG25_NODE_415_length_8258_cov_8.854026_6_plen_500_part_00